MPKKLVSALAIFIFIAINAFAQNDIQTPQLFVDVSYPKISGKTIEVAADGDFQAALGQASPGDEIVLQAGASYIGNFRLPKKPEDNWIVIRTSDLNGIPPEGNRANPSHSNSMPKIISQNTMPAISTESGAHHYRLVGIEITTQHSNTDFTHSNVIFLQAPESQDSIEKIPNHIIFDRTYIHGTATGNVRRGLGMNSAHTAVIDSYLSDFHEIGADTQAIAGWNGPGPFKITNNYLEAAGENIMFGGSDPEIMDLVPSDIEITGNHFFKPLSWKENDPSYGGIHWTVKNLFELKNARRVLVDSNLFENNWADAQIGVAILLKSANQDGKCPWCVTEHVTFSNNIVKNSEHGLTINAAEGNPLPKKVNSISIKNVLFENINGRLFQIFDGVNNVRIEHITGLSDYSILMPGDTDIPNENFVFANNIVKRGQYGIVGNGEGKDVLDRKFAPYTYNNNLIVLDDYSGIEYLNSKYPPETSFAQIDDVGFTDWRNGNYELASASPFKSAASDGADFGADVQALKRAGESAAAGSFDMTNNIGLPSSSESSSAAAASANDDFEDDEDEEGNDEDIEENDGNNGEYNYEDSEQTRFVNSPSLTGSLNNNKILANTSTQSRVFDVKESDILESKIAARMPYGGIIIFNLALLNVILYTTVWKLYK